MICVIKTGSNELTHGAVHDDEVFVSVGFDADDFGNKDASIPDQGAPWLYYELQLHILDQISNAKQQVLR